MEEISAEQNASVEHNDLELVYKSTLRYADQVKPKKVLEETTIRFQMVNKNLFGLEVDAKRIIEWKLQELIKEKNRPNLPGQYLPFSLVPLLWRDEEGLPRLVTFDLNSPRFCITGFVSGSKYKYDEGWTVSEPLLPQAILECYKSKKETLYHGNIHNARKVYKYVIFHGFILESVKEKIFRARKLFNDNIFVVAEARDWKIEDTGDTYGGGSIAAQNQELATSGSDPLVIGYKDGYCWLITAFDVTPLEQIAISISG